MNKIKKTLSIIFLIVCLFTANISSIFAEENLYIDQITYEELLRKKLPDVYLTLSNEEKFYFDNIMAEEILGYEENDNQEQILVTKQNNRGILFDYHFFTNFANIYRSGDSINYYGQVVCLDFVSPRIVLSVFLIRKSDGRIMDSKSDIKNSASNQFVSDTYDVDKSTSQYYCKSVATVTAPDATWSPQTCTTTRTSSTIN